MANFPKIASRVFGRLRRQLASTRSRRSWPTFPRLPRMLVALAAGLPVVVCIEAGQLSQVCRGRLAVFAAGLLTLVRIEDVQLSRDRRGYFVVFAAGLPARARRAIA
jgi:hypothetical protein